MSSSETVEILPLLIPFPDQFCSILLLFFPGNSLSVAKSFKVKTDKKTDRLLYINILALLVYIVRGRLDYE